MTKSLKNEEIDKNKLRQFIKEGHLTICHVRCIIVGCDGAGKTTLLKRLEGATLKNIKNVSGTEPHDIHVSDFEVVRQKKTIQRNVYLTFNIIITFRPLVLLITQCMSQYPIQNKDMHDM